MCQNHNIILRLALAGTSGLIFDHLGISKRVPKLSTRVSLYVCHTSMQELFDVITILES